MLADELERLLAFFDGIKTSDGEQTPQCLDFEATPLTPRRPLTARAHFTARNFRGSRSLSQNDSSTEEIATEFRHRELLAAHSLRPRSKLLFCGKTRVRQDPDGNRSHVKAWLSRS